MKDIWKEARWVLAAGGAPCLGFVIGILFSFLFYPHDVEGAGRLITTFAGTGGFIGIFLTIHRLRQISWEKDE